MILHQDHASGRVWNSDFLKHDFRRIGYVLWTLGQNPLLLITLTHKDLIILSCKSWRD